LYYKPITIVNDDSSVVNKLEISLTDDAIAIIYDCHIFIVQATGILTQGRLRTVDLLIMVACFFKLQFSVQ
jgi:hypothetical protein